MDIYTMDTKSLFVIPPIELFSKEGAFLNEIILAEERERNEKLTASF
jgi:hypothetical protein